MPTIPLIDLRAQYQSIKPEIDEAIQRVLDGGQFILGPEVEALEREIAAYCGTTHAVAVASGTDALELSLRAFGIGPGDEVITTAFSFFATAEAIIAVGAVPVFVDIEPVTYNLDPTAVAARVTPRTKAIILVHLYGHPCAMDPLMAIAKAHRLKVLEDCAQAIGARYRNQPVGSFGHAGALSFFPSKNLGGYGDGGMVVTSDATLAEQVRLLRVHGSRERYQHVSIGKNSRLDELQAAILRVKLRHLDEWNEARRRNVQHYNKAFQARRVGQLVLPRELPDCRHVYHLYSIRTPERSRIQEILTRQGIATQIAYPSPLTTQPALASYLKNQAPCPVASAVSQDILALPFYPELPVAAIDTIVDQIAGVLEQTHAS